MVKPLLILILIFCCTENFAQQNNLLVNSQPRIGFNIEKRQRLPDSTHSPHKAVIRSLIIPGAGQVYNHQIWKAPVIYAGLGVLMSSIIYYQANYAEAEALATIKRTGSIPGPGDAYYDLYIKYKKSYEEYAKVSYENFVSASDAYRRNRDLSILGFLALWGINVIDSYISAKFIHSYSMDDNLTFKPVLDLNKPSLYAGNNIPYHFSMGIVMMFK